jgi:AraC-like DNA-binding protein
MSVFKLPDDIVAAKENKPGSLIFHNYAAPIGSFSGKSMLNKNAISLVISGEKTMHFAEKMVVVKDDEFHFLSTGNCLVSMKLSDTTQFKSVLIFFDDTALTNFYIKYNQKVEAARGKQKIKNEAYLTFKKDAFILHFIASLQLLFQTNVPVSAEMKQLKFEELMLHLLEKFPLQLLSFQTNKNNSFDDLEIRKVVETNISNAISVDEMAFLCNVSVSTFKRRFTTIYGSSPGKWLLQKRMALAKDLLLHHHEKPGEIFYKVGYENHSSFTQSFKQTFGVTPKDYQSQQLNFQQ